MRKWRPLEVIWNLTLQKEESFGTENMTSYSQQNEGHINLQVQFFMQAGSL